jgi:kynurenine 3-monooxygenase
MISLNRTSDLCVVGAGLVGSLLSIYLAKRGFHVDLFERRSDMRKEIISAGRSINLAVSTRGLQALRKVGLEEEILRQAIPMRGRMIHAKDGSLNFQPYGKDDSEYINSVSRATLNKVLMSRAEETKLVDIYFNQKAVGMDFDKCELYLEDATNDQYTTVATTMVMSADGSSSALRDDMLKRPGYTCSEEALNYAYKELVIPPGEGGTFRMEKNALHIWPRGTYMLIALPNFDGSYTCTLFLPFEGMPSFAALKTPEDVLRFFKEEFSDAVPLIADLAETFFANPTGHMVTVKCGPWHVEEKALLLGDAAHAIVPFFGQGMNCGFEDLTVLSDCMDHHVKQGGSLYINRRNVEVHHPGRRAVEGSTAWSKIFSEFFHQRKENTDAIADMAVENFIEMRDKVADPKFQLEKAVEKILQREFPKQYVSRYSLVTFSTVPYSLAKRAGVATDEILQELCTKIETAEQVDLKKAQKLIEQKLTPLLQDHQAELPVR